MSSIMKRALICAGLLVLVGLTIAFRPYVFPAVIIGTGLLCQWEVYRAFLKGGYKPIIWTGMLFVASLYPVYHFWGIEGNVCAYLGLTAVSLVWAVFMPERQLKDTMVSVFAMFYPGWCFLSLVMVNEFKPRELADVGTALLLLVPSLCDMGAYLGGRWFGKHKLAPKISPKKTVEGAVGGLIFGMLTALAIGLIARCAFHFTVMPFWCYPVLGLLMSAFGQIGDLTASALKRATGVKDFSRLLGEHGGMMDRADSVLLATVILATFYCLLFKV